MSGKTSNKSKATYNARAYDRIELIVKKGNKEELKTHASNRNESLNAFINRAISETIQRDNEDNQELPF